MLRAEVYALNNNGTLSFDYEGLTIEFDDIYGEAENLIVKMPPAGSHKPGEFMTYIIEFTRDEVSALELFSYTTIN